MKKIPFSPPDITDAEINEVIDTLKSGWITTGPKTKLFEQKIAKYCGTTHAVCLNSATAGLELSLRLFGIGEGDEVITTPYTFASTANIILHVGATPIFVDVSPDSFLIDPTAIERAITPRTKAVIPVDFAGIPADYHNIKKVLERNKNLYTPTVGTKQETLDRPLLIADAAHALGAKMQLNNNWLNVGTLADFTVFSFHAVKNLTTAEGGAVTFCDISTLKGDDLYREFMLFSLHGQSKDALAKMQAGGWQYNIELAGYKCNMTDIMAAIGLAQLKRYPTMLARREEIYHHYKKLLSANASIILPEEYENRRSSFHIMPVRLHGFDEAKRNDVISKLAQAGISANVHFIPLPMQPLYKQLGYNIVNYPNAYSQYCNEITLPLYSTLTLTDADFIAKKLLGIIQK